MVWMELIEIFRGGDDPLKVMADEFMEMLKTTHEMAQIVAPHVLANSLPLEDGKKISDLDVKVDNHERSIRKKVVSHLSTGGSQAPYCLLLMSLVKDVERIGDYVKNIGDVSTLGGGPISEGELKNELVDLVKTTNQLFHETPGVLADQSRDRAKELLRIHANATKRCDNLLVQSAKSDLQAAEVTSIVLLTRFHKRVMAHLRNILTSIVVPLHKVDFYDEQEAVAES